jgi:hypothetical protein
MEGKLREEIKNLKQELLAKKENISDIGQLLNIGSDIDRNFHTDLWELSERELDVEMGDRLSVLNGDIDIRPDIHSITSHRNLLGKPIVLIKRFLMKVANLYTNLILEKQRIFNSRLVAFHLASFIRFRKNEEKLDTIMEKLKELEENQEFLLDKLNKIEGISNIK